MNNPHVTQVAERYKSKLRTPTVTFITPPDLTLKESIQDLPEKNRFGQGTQFRSLQPVDVGGGQFQLLGHGERTFAGRGLKHGRPLRWAMRPSSRSAAVHKQSCHCCHWVSVVVYDKQKQEQAKLLVKALGIDEYM